MTDVHRTDIEVEQDFGTVRDGRGDFQSVTSYRDTTVQRAMLRVLNAVYDDRGTDLTPTNVRDIRDKAERALSNDPVVDEPVRVSSRTADQELVLTVQVGERISFNIDLS